VTKVLETDMDKTVLEVLTTGDVLAGTFEFSGGAGPRTITTAQLAVALGGETDFNPEHSPPGECSARRGDPDTRIGVGPPSQAG